MSASQEKKRRQVQREEGSDKRLIRAEEEKAKKRKSRRIAIIIAAVLVVIALFVIFLNSSIPYRSMTAVEINGKSYSAADFNFYYFQQYYSYLNYVNSYYGDSASTMVPDTSKPLSSQTYSGDMTWADYFEQMALETMKSDAMLCDAAAEAGYTLDDDRLAELEQVMQSNESSSAYYGYDSVKQFYTGMYGQGMTEEIFRRNLTNRYIADGYSEAKKASFTYTDDELETYYQENRDTYDFVTFRAFSVSAEETDGDDEAAKTAAMEDAKALADSYAAAVHDEASFLAAATAYNAESYGEESSTLHRYQKVNVSSYYVDWLFDSARQSGDVTVAEGSSSYFVVYFIGREDNHYNTVDVRHILIKPEEVDESQYEGDEDGLAAAQAEALAAAQTRIEEINAEWLAGDATEESFAALADQYSDDSPEGGLIERVYRKQMAEGFDDWIFDSARKSGDTGIVQTTYGYHLIYFVGENMQYSSYLADTQMRSDAYTEWSNERMAAYETATTGWAFRFTK